MADIKISQLGAAVAVVDADVIPATANGVTVKVPASVLKEYAIGGTDISSIGDGTPTGAISALKSVKIEKTDIAPIETSVASKAYAVGDQLYYNGMLYSVIAAIAQGETLVVDTNIELSDKVTEQIKALNGEVSTLNEALSNEVTTRATNGAHNLLPYPNDLVINPESYAGITHTVQSDGSVILNGTATRDTDVILIRRIPQSDYISSYFQYGEYVYCLLDSSDNIITYTGISLNAGVTYNNSYVQLGAETSPGIYEFSIDANTNCDYKLDDGSCMVALYIRIDNGTVVNNLRVYPLLKAKSDTSFKYSMYAPTNRKLELENQKVSNALQENLAIVADGDVHGEIKYGELVYVKHNKHGLSEGLYQNRTVRDGISANAELSSANLTVVPNGGLNALVHTYEEKTVTLSTTQYTQFYYADVTVTGDINSIESILVVSTTSNRPAFVTQAGNYLRVWGIVAETEVTIRIFFT